jgi:tRNA(Leu) C34 or U34 (ribose-2'-O)-methylase TrmL
MNPKYAHNVAGVYRLAACDGLEQIWYTGDRIRLESTKEHRLPREERLRAYGDVTIFNCDRPFDAFPSDTVFVGVEVLRNAESLPVFEHPLNAVYVFGPEDGGLSKVVRRHCWRFVTIPTRHCLNLVTAVDRVLWDRWMKLSSAGQHEWPVLNEHRGFIDDPELYDDIEDRRV